MLLKVSVRHDDGNVETIETTDEHPFWVEFGKADPLSALHAEQKAECEPTESPLLTVLKPIGVWMRADALQPGVVLRTVGGLARVVSLHFTNERQTVYNITVEGLSTYHVGPDGVVVNNCGHHAWPKFLGGPESQRLVDMPKHLHERFHGDLYTALHRDAGISKPRSMTWAAYFQKNPEKYEPAIKALYEVSARFDAEHLNKPNGYSRSLVRAIVHEMTQ
jgi:hypothetical protein